MKHKPRIKSAFIFLLLLGVLFGALALIPVLAQSPRHGRAAPDEPLVQAMAPSLTGYVIDDGDAGFTATVTPDGWALSGPMGYGNDFVFSSADGDGDYARWRPDLPAGLFQVQVHYVAHSTYYSRARYEVTYDGGTAFRLINQQLLGDQSTAPPALGADSGWCTLGVYPFAAGTSGFVTLLDVTNTFGAPAAAPLIADAVRFLPGEVWVDDNYTPASHGGHTWGVNAFDNIPAGLQAVADYGTVHVGPGTYYAPITVTREISLTGAGAASTAISATLATADAAIQLMASKARISGFTIETSDAFYGIRNYDYFNEVAPPGVNPVPNLTGYRIFNNVIRGFTRAAIRMDRCKGEISGNMIYNNTRRGIWVEEAPTAAGLEGPTTVSGNHLYSNGSSGVDPYHLEIEGSYTGTVVSGNLITGTLTAGEIGIYVLNEAGDLAITSNRVTGCSEGVRIRQSGGAGIIQKASLQDNVITGGTVGIGVLRTGGTALLREILIGGNTGSPNQIYGNSGFELELTGYEPPISATYNYWGVCTLREIEDEIYHNYDLGTLGPVSFSPAICVPYTLTVQASPVQLPADGASQSFITVTVRDVLNRPVDPGTMVGVTTSFGTLPYGYAEAEGPDVVLTGVWVNPAGFGRASGGQVRRASAISREMDWTFTGQAVSVLYAKDVGGGIAEVYIDGSLVMTINMASTLREYRVEDVVSDSLDPSVPHTIKVKPDGSGNIWVDAFRSGGLTGVAGRITTRLTAPTLPGTASIWGTVYFGGIVTDTSTLLQPIITATASVSFGAADVYATKVATPTTLIPGQDVQYTVTYGNNGPETATGVCITDTLPANFQLISSPGNQLAWCIGSVGPGVTGTITLVARPYTTATWSAPTVVTNWVDIDTLVAETSTANNTGPCEVIVGPAKPASVVVIAAPAAILANNVATSTITATVRDAMNNTVADGTAVAFSTSLAGTTFLPGGMPAATINTVSGVATTTLKAGTVAGTATVTAQANGVQGTAQVQVLPLVPYTVTISANPTWIRVDPRGVTTSTLSITVTDRYYNLVDGARVNLTTTAGSFVGSGITTHVVYTTRGYAVAGLASGCSVTTATVTAGITTTGRPTATASVFFQAGLPYTITSVANPSMIRVCGGDTGKTVVTATIRDECGNLVEDGTEVSFAVVQGDRGQTYPQLTRTVNGIATTEVRTKPYAFGERFLHVHIVSRRETRQIEYYHRIDLTQGLANSIALTPSPTRIAVGGAVSTIRARVTDCAGNNVDDGTPVTFTVNALGTVTPTVTTTFGGQAETTFRSLCAMGTAVITATADGKSFSTTVLLEPGPADRIVVDITPDTIRNCGGRTTVVAMVYDACNNLVKDGTLVQFTPLYRYVSTSPVLAVTHNGRVSAVVTALNKPLETWPYFDEQIDVTSGSAMPGFDNVRILPGATDHVDVTADPGSIPINGDVNFYDITVVAHVEDCSNTPVEDGTLVRLETSLGIFRDSGSRSYSATTLRGLITATLTSQSDAGIVTITGTAEGISGTTQVRFLPGEPFYIEMSAIPATIPADGRSTSLIVAGVKDAYNNFVMDGVTVTFVTQYGVFVETSSVYYTTTTNANGFAFARLLSEPAPRTTQVLCVAYNYRQGYTYVFFEHVTTRYVYLPVIKRLSPR